MNESPTSLRGALRACLAVIRGQNSGPAFVNAAQIATAVACAEKALTPINEKLSDDIDLLEVHIAKDADWDSTMVRAGLLRSILEVARYGLSKLDGERTPTLYEALVECVAARDEWINSTTDEASHGASQRLQVAHQNARQALACNPFLKLDSFSVFTSLKDIVDFCDDPDGSEKGEDIAGGLARLLPAARAAVRSYDADPLEGLECKVRFGKLHNYDLDDRKSFVVCPGAIHFDVDPVTGRYEASVFDDDGRGNGEHIFSVSWDENAKS